MHKRFLFIFVALYSFSMEAQEAKEVPTLLSLCKNKVISSVRGMNEQEREDLVNLLPVEILSDFAEQSFLGWRQLKAEKKTYEDEKPHMNLIATNQEHTKYVLTKCSYDGIDFGFCEPEKDAIFRKILHNFHRVSFATFSPKSSLCAVILPNAMLQVYDVEKNYKKWSVLKDRGPYITECLFLNETQLLYTDGKKFYQKNFEDWSSNNPIFEEDQSAYCADLTRVDDGVAIYRFESNFFYSRHFSVLMGVWGSKRRLSTKRSKSISKIVSGGNKRFALLCNDKVVEVYSFTCAEDIFSHYKSIELKKTPQAAAFSSPDYNLLAVGSAPLDSAVYLFDLNSHDCIRQCEGNFNNLYWSSDSSSLLAQDKMLGGYKFSPEILKFWLEDYKNKKKREKLEKS